MGIKTINSKIGAAATPNSSLRFLYIVISQHTAQASQTWSGLLLLPGLGYFHVGEVFRARFESDSKLSFSRQQSFPGVRRRLALNVLCFVVYLSDRQAIIRDAISAHKTGQFTLSIPAMLPLAEGLAAEILETTATGVVRALAEDWRSAEAEAWSQEFWNAVDKVIYKRYAFGKEPATYLNRRGMRGLANSVVARAFSMAQI
jgi:hypothetical protein